MKTLLRYLALLLIIVAVAGIVFSIGGRGDAVTGGKVHIEIPEGATGRDIGRILADKDLVTHPLIFEISLRVYGNDKPLRSGEYTLERGMSTRQLIKALEGGARVEVVRVTIPEGLTVRQVAQKINGTGKLTAVDLERLAAAPTPALRSLVPWSVESLEGYLFPDTYELKATAPTEELISRMLTRFSSLTSSLDWSEAGKRGLTRQEIIVVASLIEREAKLPEERPLVAAVVYNRLAKRMPLQIDATIQYALPQVKPRLTFEDLKIESPYNTYLHSGLPPGPIASPGLASIEAALKPAVVNFLYYVLVDPNGKHAFAETHEEFLKAKRKAKR